MPGPSPSPFLPLVAYAEALCSGARILLVGDALGGIAEQLVARGARLVHVCDEVAPRRAQAAQRTTDRTISFGSLDDGSFALREGFFDLGLVESLAAHSDPKAVLAALSRLLAPRGTALVATPNLEARRPLLGSDVGSEARTPGIDYYALYDAVTAQFARVRMLGQVPFVGYALVDFATEGEPSVVFDASLVPSPGEEPDYFVAAAGEGRGTLEAYAVVQLPSADVLGETELEFVAEAPLVAQPSPVVVAPAPVAPTAPVAPPGPSPAEQAERARLEAWIAELEARGHAADARADAAEAELDELRERQGNLEQNSRREREALHGERAELKAELERQGRHKHDLGELVRSSQTESSDLRAQLAVANEQVAAANEKLTAANDRLTVANDQLSEATEKLAAAQQKLAALEEDAASVEELKRLEAQLAERGERIRALERELRDAERTGRELVRRLARPVQSPPPPPPSASPERVAELEAERVVLAWALQIARGEGGVASPARVPPGS